MSMPSMTSAAGAPVNEHMLRGVELSTAHGTGQSTLPATGTGPYSVRPHMKLGIARAGIITFLFRIGFPFNTHRHADRTLAMKTLAGVQVGQTYVRNQQDLGNEIPSSVPDIFCVPFRGAGLNYTKCRHRDVKGLMPVGLTGYDLCVAIRKWCRANGYADKSVCEILQEEGSSVNGRPDVGLAQVFYSHVQKESVNVRLETLTMMPSSGPLSPVMLSDNLYIWIDYVSLRQCLGSEFVPNEIVQLISDLGQTIIELDHDHAYMRKSFCLLESYAAVECKGKVLCRAIGIGDASDDMKNACSESTCRVFHGLHYPSVHVDSRSATTWRASNKALIDDYIESLPGGFAYLNKVLLRSFKRSMRLATYQHVVPNTPSRIVDACPVGWFWGCSFMHGLTCCTSCAMVNLCCWPSHGVCCNQHRRPGAASCTSACSGWSPAVCGPSWMRAYPCLCRVCVPPHDRYYAGWGTE